MSSWFEFATSRPLMAEVLTRRLAEVPITYLATVRRDGSPRVHPVCPVIADGKLYVAVAGTGRQHPSPKRYDLRNDGRYAMHALPGPRDEEFYCTGRARLTVAEAERTAVVTSAGHTIHAADDVFELKLESVMTAYWENLGQPNTYAVRQFWRPR